MTTQQPTRNNWLVGLWEYSREPMNALTHGLGAILAIIGAIILVWMARDTPGRAITLIIFGITMVLVYSASTAMHHYNGDEETFRLLHRLDHAAIYLMIAGTYTPFTFAFLEGMPMWRWGILITIWSLAFIGLTLKLFFNMYGHVSTLFYVLMGWVALIAVPPYLQSDYSNALWLILAGGITYTIGAIFFAIKKPNFHRHFGHHEIWHLFVIGGSACHFAAMVIWVA